MENGPIFEQIPGNIILDDQENEKYFYNPINDLHHHHNDDNNSEYVPYNSDGDGDILGSWEAEYVAMDEKEGMIITHDDIEKGWDISDLNYISRES